MQNFENLVETQLESREIFDGHIMHVFKDTVRLPNGANASREYMRHVGAVCVVPLLDDGSVLLERQFRYPVGQVLIEIPAGKLDSKAEDPQAAAKRELLEETGAVAGELIELGLFFPACAYSDEAIHMYAAKNITFREQKLDEDEFLNVFRLPLRELVEKVLNGEIPDAKTQAAALRVWCMLQEGKLSRGGSWFIFRPSVKTAARLRGRLALASSLRSSAPPPGSTALRRSRGSFRWNAACLHQAGSCCTGRSTS